VAELPPEGAEAPDNNCYFDAAAADALISCMDKAVKQAPDSISAAVTLLETRRKLEKIVQAGRPG